MPRVVFEAHDERQIDEILAKWDPATNVLTRHLSDRVSADSWREICHRFRQDLREVAFTAAIQRAAIEAQIERAAMDRRETEHYLHGGSISPHLSHAGLHTADDDRMRELVCHLDDASELGNPVSALHFEAIDDISRLYFGDLLKEASDA